MNLYLRFIYLIVKNLLFRKRIRPTEKTTLTLRVLPNDCDINMHMNNGRFLTIMDLGRFELIVHLGLFKKIYHEKLSPIVAGANITFFKSLAPLEKYNLITEILCWDQNWFYVQQQFLKLNGALAATALVKVTFLREGKKIPPQTLLEEIGNPETSPKAPSYLIDFLASEKHLIQDAKASSKV